MINKIIPLLGGVKQASQNQWQAICPCHDDNRASLSIKNDPSTGIVSMYCHACKAQGPEVLKALKLDIKKETRKITKTYPYYSESGKLLFEVVRYEPKNFLQRRPDGKGGWVWKGISRYYALYNLPEIARAEPRAAWIVIVEGEKDADRLNTRAYYHSPSSPELLATTYPSGAGKWRQKYNEHLAGHKVAILPDNDDPGKKAAEIIAQSLSTHKEPPDVIKVVELPDLPVKGDVSDWLDKGNTIDDLLGLIEEEGEYVPVLQGKIEKYALTESGNGKRFANMHKNKLRYCHTWEKWLYYDGKVWRTNNCEQVSSSAQEVIQAIYADAANATTDFERSQISKHAIRSDSRPQAANMLWWAAREPEMCVYAESFDTDIWKLNVLNGTIDLRTGKLLDHDKNDLITKLCPVEYDPDADQKPWLDFLVVACQGDYPLMEFLQTSVGYSLTGDTGEEKLFFVHGPEGTGKSTFLESIKAMMGDYAQTADFETFLYKKFGGGTRNDVAALAGCRFVSSIETDKGTRLAEGLVKQLTGGDTVRARFLYQESFEFMPQFKLWLAANDAPRVSDTDGAMWRRILRLPFEYVVPKKDRQASVKAKLKSDMAARSGILAWAIQGCLRWQKDGLGVPDIVEDATEDYRADQNPLKDFFEDCCEFFGAAVTPSAEIRKRYEEYCHAEGVRYMLGPKEFSNRLKDRGCVSKTEYFAGQSQRCWRGVGLRADQAEKGENDLES